MKQPTHVSEAVIRRLPRYYRKLDELERRGVTRVSSGDLSQELNLNPSQIRQDFNCFGGYGQQGYGYQVSMLRREIAAILGLTRKYRAVVVGAGHIGQALVQYYGFEREGFDICGIFDIKPSLIGAPVGSLRVLSADGLTDFVRENGVEIGIITTQKDAAQSTANKLAESGVRGIWNFTPMDVMTGVPVENVSMNDSLYILAYRLQQ